MKWWLRGCRVGMVLVTAHCGSAPDAPKQSAGTDDPGTDEPGLTAPEGGENSGSSTAGEGDTPSYVRPGRPGTEQLPSDLGATNGANGSGSGNGDSPANPDPPTATDCSLSSLEPGNLELSLEHDGVERQYLVHVPASYDGSAPVPLVVDMHGLTSSANAQAQFGWRQKADAEGFIVVHPQGLNASWNGGELCCGSSQANDVDDEGFIRAMVAQMRQDACIDGKRVYATGLSNGGAMSHLLACNAADIFAATAPVSMSNGASPCEPSRPISVVMTRGTSDPLVAFEGGFLFASAEADFTAWAERNGCTGELKPNHELCRTFDACEGGVEVTLCTLDAGHVLYSNSQNFSVPDVVWETFERQTLP